jgi:1,2-dihydroxy-3-keto-5-methylthiopentene dioxygenase
MTELTVLAESNPEQPLLKTDVFDEAQATLAKAGIQLERWQATAAVGAGADQETVIAAYKPDIDRLMARGGYQSVDVVSMTPDHPDRAAMRQKFLHEHRHSEDEVRFFVDGQGLFSLHVDDKVYEVLCTRGDLINVPANTRHWFDMGSEPSFVAIRLFTNPEGWVAQMTGSDIAARFSRLA